MGLGRLRNEEFPFIKPMKSLGAGLTNVERHGHIGVKPGTLQSLINRRLRMSQIQTWGDFRAGYLLQVFRHATQFDERPLLRPFSHVYDEHVLNVGHTR